MAQRALGEEGDRILEQVLGYLNFSSGAADAQFLSNLNELYGIIAQRGFDKAEPAWRVAGDLLKGRLADLAGNSPAFSDAAQADAVLGLLLDHLLPGYLQFHRDLLFHQGERTLLGPFFVGRACEALLAQGPPWDEVERITQGAITRLNDYIGHRPVATLESQRIEPYVHERVRPIPIFIRGVAVTHGSHREVIELALRLLAETDDDLLRAAFLDPTFIDELAVDPRAYDFDHPVNKRPNYHFGQWDPHCIDNKGRFRRFVVQQVTLEALMDRVEHPGKLSHDEVVFEAAAVLAGTILMAAGISGAGPDSHDSNATLGNLLPGIAAYRDAFYERLFSRITGAHAARLRKEADERRQPFGGARQHLNAQLARRRASQLEHVQLAKIFARMGYPEAAQRQADVVPTASARMLCRIDCLLSTGQRAVEQRDLAAAESLLPEIVDLLRRAIECGAVVDPWNILGFDAHFSLFPALENSVHDHRVDDLVAVVEQLFAFYSRIWSEAAAVDDQPLCQRMAAQFRETADWWRQFAAHEVEGVACGDADDTFRAAEHVARALNLWHKGGAAAGDVAFWAPHAEMFDSPQAYALVIEALLDRGDFVASMALLAHWIGFIDRMDLEHGDGSFQHLAQRWLIELCRSHHPSDGDEARPAAEIWKMVCRFFDHLEANAEEFWTPPRFEMGALPPSNSGDAPFAGGLPDNDDEDDESLFGAAYEEMVYRDSTDDGVEGDIFDNQSTASDDLEFESKRIVHRLALLESIARLWSLAMLEGPHSENLAAEEQIALRRGESIARWVGQAAANRQGLLDLLDAVHAYRLPPPLADHDSLVEYDRRRFVKESLLERIIVTCIETADAQRMLLAASPAAADTDALQTDLEEDQLAAVAVVAAVLQRDVETVRDRWSDLIDALGGMPLLYVPLAKGGNPREIVAARVRQRTIQDLLSWLPRLGMLAETCRLIETAREMERNHSVGAGAVTEFDELFKYGYTALVEALVASSASWHDEPDDADDDPGSPQAALVESLEKLTESLLISWLAHSRTLRLSVLEKVKDRGAWRRLVTFIENYGGDLFTQRFFNLGNIRAILHQGVDTWLQQLQEEEDEDMLPRLVGDLDSGIPFAQAVDQLTLVLEAIIENYGEYRDYNSTTTQSDRGELLYTLLDFLRLRMNYDRVSWQLKPVVWAHEILVRQGQIEAAKMWRRSLAERFRDEANKYLRRLAQLQKKYAMRMPTVADRLAERFIGPMSIDRICALVEPALREAGQPPPHRTFELLEHEAESLTREPTGVGLDMPAWLAALVDEVEDASRPDYEREVSLPAPLAEPVILPRDEAMQQLDDWSQRT